MSTNFYVRGHKRNDSPDTHIGKRSAAGYYCWDCDITLCQSGNGGIHYSDNNDKWYDKCPQCGKPIIKEDLDHSSPGRELGFNDNLPARKTGVKTCCSFSWAMSQELYNAFIAAVKVQDLLCPCCVRKFDDKDKIIEDEYGRLFTLEEFNAVLSECPIRFFDGVGTEFS